MSNEPNKEQDKTPEKTVESEAIKAICAEFNKQFTQLKKDMETRIAEVEKQNATNLRAIVSGAKMPEPSADDDDKEEPSREDIITEKLRKRFNIKLEE